MLDAKGLTVCSRVGERVLKFETSPLWMGQERIRPR